MSLTTTLTPTGQQIPLVGLGTWRPGAHSSSTEIRDAVIYAVEHAKYRHIDCANKYLNEDQVGDALADLLTRGVVKRDEIFVTGKLNNPYHRTEHVRDHLLKTLKDLNLEYLDLWLMHWPTAYHFVPYDKNRRGFDPSYDPNRLTGIDLTPYGGSPVDESVSVEETWRAMEACVQEGLVKNIGVSNFTVALLHDLMSYAKIKPAVNQVECHPYLTRSSMLSYCKSRGIVLQAYSPLGTPGFKKAHEPSVLSDSLLNRLAAKYNKSPAQIAIRWQIQRGVVVIPKSTNPERIRQNIDVFDFKIEQEDMTAIEEGKIKHSFLDPGARGFTPLFN